MFTNEHLRSGRKDRVESGFDFLSSAGKYANLSGSHSELISRVISQLIVDDVKRNGHLMYRAPADFSEWLDGIVYKMGKASPEDLLKHLKNVKK